MRKSWLDGFGPRVFQTKSKEEYIQGMTNCSVQLNTGNDIESGEMRREAERKRLWQSVRHDKRVWGLLNARGTLVVFSQENMTRFVLKRRSKSNVKNE